MTDGELHVSRLALCKLEDWMPGHSRTVQPAAHRTQTSLLHDKISSFFSSPTNNIFFSFFRTLFYLCVHLALTTQSLKAMKHKMDKPCRCPLTIRHLLTFLYCPSLPDLWLLSTSEHPLDSVQPSTPLEPIIPSPPQKHQQWSCAVKLVQLL